MAPLKILVAGDVDGKFEDLFTIVKKFNKNKGPFEYLLCIGNFFGSDEDDWEDLKDGHIKVPITTYILGPNKKEHLKFYPDNSGELVPDLIYLGKRGVLTGSSGLKIAYLSGVEANESTECSFSKKEVTDLTNSITDPIDVLLTSQWPKGITKYAKITEGPDPSEVGSSAIAYLAKHIKPKYHFSAMSGIYYQRFPYRNHEVLQETSKHFSRFFGLASLGNETKSKWLYAFNIDPFSSKGPKGVQDYEGPVTECPYSMDEYEDQFFYDIHASGSSKRPRNEAAQSSKRKPPNPVTPENCWFCMENPKFDKRLVLSIGDYNYLTLAKGGMVKEHLLIIPIEHTQSSVHLSAAEEYEINRYKEALVKYFHEKEKDVVFFERSLASPHLQIQVVPIPKSEASELKGNIMEFADDNGVELHDLSKYALVNQLVPAKKQFFFVEIWIDKKKEGRLLHVIEGNFPLQFGRMMLASKDILDIPERVDWKDCEMDPNKELKEVEQFKMSFEPYELRQ